jgi:carbon monoxide dehydrogenase subunit G
MILTYAIEIDRRPDQVFPWIADPERAMTWMTSVSGGEILKRTPDLVGTTFRETVSDKNGSTELRGVVTACRPNQSLAFHLEGEFNKADVEYTLARIPRGTRLTMRAEVRFKGIVRVLGVLLRPVFRRKVLGQFAREFDELKRLCEKEG